jgi:hypothetical protein
MFVLVITKIFKFIATGNYYGCVIIITITFVIIIIIIIIIIIMHSSWLAQLLFSYLSLF